MKFANVFYSVSASGLLLMACGTVALAQTPGGGGMSPAQTPQSQSRPSVNNPIDQNGQASVPAKVDDKKFLKDAAQGGLTEVALGKLAAEKGSSDEVKQFGQKMVDDHTKANEKLKDVASQDNVQVPDSLDSKHQSRIDKLGKLSGDKFDKAYVKDQLKDHESDVRDFQSEAQHGNDPKVKAFAAETLPTLQQHLELVKSLQKTGEK